GIRDLYVTGVQRVLFRSLRTRLRVAIPPTFGRQHLVPRLPEFTALYPHIDLELHLAVPFLDVKAEDTDIEIRYGTGRYPDLKTRSEERRVGKECRSGWSP